MKYSFDTYRLYQSEKIFAYTIRIKVTMKEEIDGDVLRSAANVAIKRYPYLAVNVITQPDGAYDLIPNDNMVVVIPTSDKLPDLGSKEVNGHLLFLDYEKRDVYFNISHSLCGGHGSFPWVMTTVYQYVKEKYSIEPDSPAIRKPDSPLLENEIVEPTLDMLPDESPFYKYEGKNPHMMLSDYMNGMFNPLKRNPNYMEFAFRQKDIMEFAHQNDSSVVSVFIILMAKALDKVLPKKYKVIGAETANCPLNEMGIGDAHVDLLTHIFVDYERDRLSGNMELLGTMTRGQIMLQKDLCNCQGEIRHLINLYEETDKISGKKEKRKYIDKNNLNRGKDARHGTFLCNYTGRMDWGEVGNYVESYFAIIEGHLTMEVTSMNNRIFVTVMYLIDGRKYTKAFMQVLDEMSLPYRVRGPYPKNMVKHKI
jgi:hypothetical protein